MTHIPKAQEAEKHEKSEDLILVRYKKTVKNFRFYESIQKVTIHKNVEFDLTSELTINIGHQIIVNEKKSDESLSKNGGWQDDKVEEPRKRGQAVAKNRIYEEINCPIK